MSSEEARAGFGAQGAEGDPKPQMFKSEINPPLLPEGVLAVRVGPGANCSSAGSAIDILFYGSVIASALAVALAAALPPKEKEVRSDEPTNDQGR